MRKLYQDNLKDAMQESVIKRFEICFDTLITHLKKFMEEQSGKSINYYAKTVILTATRDGIINREIYEQLENYREIKNKAAHNYGEEYGQEVINSMTDFIEDASALYQEMADWE